MTAASIPTPSHQVMTINHQQKQEQPSNQTRRAGGQANNDQRVNGMQHSGMTYDPSQAPFLMFPPDATGVRPPKSDITQFQNELDRAVNKPFASNRASNHTARNPTPNPPREPYWACCVIGCNEQGGPILADIHNFCPVCSHKRCYHCRAGNDLGIPNPTTNPPRVRYWACCVDGCKEQGARTLADTHASCPVCSHKRCYRCPAGNNRVIPQGFQT